MTASAIGSSTPYTLQHQFLEFESPIPSSGFSHESRTERLRVLRVFALQPPSSTILMVPLANQPLSASDTLVRHNHGHGHHSLAMDMLLNHSN